MKLTNILTLFIMMKSIYIYSEEPLYKLQKEDNFGIKVTYSIERKLSIISTRQNILDEDNRGAFKNFYR